MQPKPLWDDTGDDRFGYRDRQGGRRPPADARRRGGGPAWMDEPVPRQPMTFDRRGVFGGPEEGRNPGRPAARWEYRDEHKVTQGPFTDTQMWRWLKDGFFASTLPIRVVGETSFTELSKLAQGATENTDFFKSYRRNDGEGRPEGRAPLQRRQPEDEPPHEVVEPDGADTSGIGVETVAALKPGAQTSRLGRWSSPAGVQGGESAAQEKEVHQEQQERMRSDARKVEDLTHHQQMQQLQMQQQMQQEQMNQAFMHQQLQRMQLHHHQQQQHLQAPVAQPLERTKSVLASLREGKSLVDPPATHMSQHVASFFDGTLPGQRSEPEPSAQIGNAQLRQAAPGPNPVSYTHLRAHETVLDLVCRLLLEKKKKTNYNQTNDNL
eukprot:TRINITY_DN2323_c0_g1_i1.p1 TRINITY_DN2323_c0_g1~~TRINITY_DN2323_c0_g1_i1.p1  ORF type:complete len:380 (+),score=73.96 TRINITY_DN2323_c0_g1_i1:269-1408(+)